MRLLLLALLLGSSASIASACVEEQSAQTTVHAKSHQMPVPCERMTLRHKPLTCECPPAVVGLHAAPESNKFVSLGGAGAVGSICLPTLSYAEGRDVRDLPATPPSRSLYLMTARLRL